MSGKVLRDRHPGASLRAVLLAAVLALVAMHVLASHQPDHSGHAAAFPLVEAGDKAQHAHEDAVPGDVTRTPGSPGGESPCDHGGVGESCLALLCIAAALFTFAFRREGGTRVLGRPAEPTHAWISRTGDPPCLHRLSVLRC